jgi:hypothetical protein
MTHKVSSDTNHNLFNQLPQATKSPILPYFQSSGLITKPVKANHYNFNYQYSPYVSQIRKH